MGSRMILLKEEGTQPPAEGFLARFVRVIALRSLDDVQSLARVEQDWDVILLDLGMPSLDGGDVVRALRASRPEGGMILLIDASLTPGELARQFAELGKMRSAAPSRRPDVGRWAKMLGVSQETLARILGVSSRTIHRWVRGARPRKKPTLEQMARVMGLLEQTLPNREAIRDYLQHPNPNLLAETPLALLIRGEFERVSADLLAIQEGVYV